MEQTSLAIASAMILTTLLSFAWAPSFDAITSCSPVSISRAEAAEAVGMNIRYQKGAELQKPELSERRLCLCRRRKKPQGRLLCPLHPAGLQPYSSRDLGAPRQ